MASKTLAGIMAILALQTPLRAHSDEPASSSKPPPPVAPLPAAGGSTKATAAPPQKPAAPVKLFPVLEFRVEGNSLMQATDIERAVFPYLGTGKTIKDVEAARQNLEKLYHDRGYQTVIVNIPPQEVSAGVVRLIVTESPVGRTKIAGSKYHSLKNIITTVPQLQDGSVPNFIEVQKQLAQVNKGEDLHVTPVLRASTTPGEVDVDLDVQDKLPLHATLEANNRYSANTAHVRLIGEVSYDNLFQRNQSMSIQYQTAPDHPGEAKIWSLSYVIPTQAGPVWALYAIRSDSNIAAVGDLDVIGNGRIFGLRFIEPLASPNANFYHSFTAGVDYKDFTQDVVLQGADTNTKSPAKYPPFTLQYGGTWLGTADPAHHSAAAISGSRDSTTLDVGFEFLIRGLGTDAEQFSVKRAGAGPSFFIFHPGLTRQQLLPYNWSVFAKVDGQLSSGPLISNEQFGAGGAESVRGYTESERLGDNGIHGSLELRTPQLLSGHAPLVSQSYLYVFVDGAHVRIDDPLPAQRTGYHLASEGLGLRFKIGGLLLDFDGARTDALGYVTRSGSVSAQFRVNYTW